MNKESRLQKAEKTNDDEADRHWSSLFVGYHQSQVQRGNQCELCGVDTTMRYSSRGEQTTNDQSVGEEILTGHGNCKTPSGGGSKRLVGERAGSLYRANRCPFGSCILFPRIPSGSLQWRLAQSIYIIAQDTCNTQYRTQTKCKIKLLKFQINHEAASIPAESSMTTGNIESPTQVRK
ncbi:hypothetical protein CBL_08024 [Carabus blaptoides fortunei]